VDRGAHRQAFGLQHAEKAGPVQRRARARRGQTGKRQGRAAGNVGTDIAAKAPADGYNILFTLSSHTINPKLYDKLPFDVERDFVPVSLAAMIPQILVVHPSVPANNLKELIALAKANPGKLNYASVGTGSPGHIAGELLNQRTGANLVHIPYKGGGQAMGDALGGNIPLVFTAVAGAMPHLKSGKLVPIAVSSSTRSPSLPNTPTFIESGVRDFDVSSWVGILAPAKTPRAIIERLNRELNAALKDPEVVEKLAGMGITATPGTPEQFTEQMNGDLAKYGQVVKAAGIKAE